VNHVLGTIYKTWEIDTNGSPVIPSGCDLPCWFAEEEIKFVDKDPWLKHNIIIKYSEGSQPVQSPLDSPSEKYYIEARDKRPGEKYTPKPATLQTDYGILARIHSEDGKERIIIAGIHQLGTWIVGHLMSRLFYGENVDGMETFLGDKDFIAIIEGKFFDQQWNVSDEQVHSKFLWTYENNQWTRVIKPST
jgi:hypothetical protein